MPDDALVKQGVYDLPGYGAIAAAESGSAAASYCQLVSAATQTSMH